MSELRRDPIIGQWVIVHKEDSLGPESYEKQDQTPKHAATCQFCPGREHQTPPEVDAIRDQGSAANTPNWQVRVVPNRFSRERSATVLDGDYWDVVYLRPFRTEKMAKTGDANKALITVEYTLASLNEEASAKIADLVTSGTP